MTKIDASNVEKISPSQFMRELRPEYYSDTEDQVAYVLEVTTLEYYLESITQRNQTHDFEIFCRKLCERTICPNLRPQTGPEGGGDSKADSETYPVADEISFLTYVGEANAGRERWAFAFSAKKRHRRFAMMLKELLKQNEAMTGFFSSPADLPEPRIVPALKMSFQKSMTSR